MMPSPPQMPLSDVEHRVLQPERSLDWIQTLGFENQKERTKLTPGARPASMATLL